MDGMKRIKQIIEALKVLSRTPSSTIRKAADEVLKVAGGDGRGSEEASDESWHLVKNILDAVIGLAEEMERPAKTDSEAKS